MTGAVNVAALERDLRDLWKQMAAKSQSDGEHAVTRACVHNLAVYAPGERSESELRDLLADLMISQPGRVLLILPDPAAPADSMSAWVSAQCHLTSGQRQQVCSEQIVIRAEGREIRNLPSLVIPLLAPGLPVFFWWRDDLSAEWPHFQELVENADRVIVDSARFSRPVESLRRLLEILKEHHGATAFSDLNWNRITPWREMAAGFFDHGACRSVLSSITGVDIQASSPTGVSLQSLFLAAWLAGRMRWQPVSAGNNVILMDSGGRRIRVRIFVRPPADGAARGIVSVTMRSESPAVTFHIMRDEETRYMRASVDMAGARPAERTFRIPGAGEEECLAGEMEILGADRVFEEAMNIVERIL